MLKFSLLVLTVLWAQPTLLLPAQLDSNNLENPQRRYMDGAVSHYLMTGNNDGWQYIIRATDTVKRDANGRYYEEIRWSDRAVMLN